MENKQITAVEWMIKEIEALITIETFEKWKAIKERGRAMEKEQIAEVFDKGENPFADDGKYLHGTDYYEETYKSKTDAV
jgi:hypothetical protein